MLLAVGGVLLGEVHPLQRDGIRDPRSLREQWRTVRRSPQEISVTSVRTGLSSPTAPLSTAAARDGLGHGADHHRRPGLEGPAGSEVGPSRGALEQRGRGPDNDALDAGRSAPATMASR